APPRDRGPLRRAACGAEGHAEGSGSDELREGPRPARPAAPAPRCEPHPPAEPGRGRRPAARIPAPRRALPDALPRDGPPRRAAWHHEVQLVSALLPRPTFRTAKEATA